jgi:tRNA (guanine-N7-)-methyltransferase
MQRLIPRKGDFLMRAHINPFNTPFFPFPPHPSYVDWKLHFPLHYGGDLEDNFKIYCNTDEHPCSYDKKIINQVRNVDFLDIGCGYGGLLFGLAPLFPTKLIFGLEIRNKLVNYSAQKIRAYR